MAKIDMGGGMSASLGLQVRWKTRLAKFSLAAAFAAAVVSLSTPSAADDALFERGRQLRQEWDAWYPGLTGDMRAGADYAMAHRSDLKACVLPSSESPVFASACRKAKFYIGLRFDDPDYQAGWAAGASAAPLTRPPAPALAARPQQSLPPAAALPGNFASGQGTSAPTSPPAVAADAKPAAEPRPSDVRPEPTAPGVYGATWISIVALLVVGAVAAFIGKRHGWPWKVSSDWVLRRKTWLGAMIASFVISDVLGFDLSMFAMAAAAAAFGGVLAILGAWASGKPAGVFVKEFAGKQALQGVTYAALLGIGAAMCFWFADRQGADQTGVLAESGSATARLLTLSYALMAGAPAQSMTDGMSLLNAASLLGGGSITSICSRLLTAAAVLATGWALLWVLVGASVAIPQRIAALTGRSERAGLVGKEKVHGDTVFVDPDDAAERLGGSRR